ncbi:MAG TPA: hypothetical protein PKL77_03330 [Candidatus Omnitrophota bacterium]|nr:hypothetical protein [Candidatus Omnitrophota bacterium]HPT07297.1 hypothetical protein [Candidatus Omnitrophota bacterium]
MDVTPNNKARTFTVTILTPEKIIYDGPIVSLILPCETGYLGVWVDHAPLIANIVPGKVAIIKDHGQTPEIFQIKGKGFLEVLDNKVTVLLHHTELDA